MHFRLWWAIDSCLVFKHLIWSFSFQGTYYITSKDIHNLRAKTRKDQEKLVNRPLEVNDEFDSFYEFEQILKSYSRRNYMQFTKNDSNSIVSANKKLTPHARRFPERFVYRNVKYKCKHGDKERKRKDNLQRLHKRYGHFLGPHLAASNVLV